MFPQINHIDDLLPHIAHKPEIRVAEHDGEMAGYKTACYMIADSDTFDNEWARECRGITFFPDGRIASRSMHKFFNVGERITTQEHVLDFSKVQSIMDKRDGSMIHPVPTIDGKDYVMKSKKSFESDVAIAANVYSHNSVMHHAFVLYCIKNGLTPTFEYTSPKHRIVLNYKYDELRVLHIRHNVSGVYFTRNEIKDLIDNKMFEDRKIQDMFSLGATYTKLNMVDVIDESYEQLKASLDTKTDIEGYIIQFESGEMVKLKTPWYLDLHHNVTFQTERGVARMVLDETVDDFKSYLTSVGATESFEKVLQIESTVIKTISMIEKTVNNHYDILIALHGDDRKAFAIGAKSNRHIADTNMFGLIMQLYSGKQPDYTAFYEKYYLNERFSLDQI